MQALAAIQQPGWALTTDPPMIPTCASGQEVAVFRRIVVRFCLPVLLEQRTLRRNAPISA